MARAQRILVERNDGTCETVSVEELASTVRVELREVDQQLDGVDDTMLASEFIEPVLRQYTNRPLNAQAISRFGLRDRVLYALRRG